MRVGGTNIGSDNLETHLGQMPRERRHNKESGFALNPNPPHRANRV